MASLGGFSALFRNPFIDVPSGSEEDFWLAKALLLALPSGAPTALFAVAKPFADAVLRCCGVTWPFALVKAAYPVSLPGVELLPPADSRARGGLGPGSQACEVSLSLVAWDFFKLKVITLEWHVQRVYTSRREV